MLNRFNNPEAELPPDSPKFAIMDAWARLNAIYGQNYWALREVMGTVAADSFQARRNKERGDFNYAVEAEKRLQLHVPEIVVAFDGMRQVLDRVVGWNIKWRHYNRGEVIGNTEPHEQSEGLFTTFIVRGPATYEPLEGWVKGANAGPDRVLGGLSVQIEIGSTPESPRGIHHLLAEMFEIELIPSDQSN